MEDVPRKMILHFFVGKMTAHCIYISFSPRLTFIILFMLVLGCCLYYNKKRRLSRRSNEVIVYSAHNDSVAIPYGPTTQNTHYYMAPVMTSPSQPMIG